MSLVAGSRRFQGFGGRFGASPPGSSLQSARVQSHGRRSQAAVPRDSWARCAAASGSVTGGAGLAGGAIATPGQARPRAGEARGRRGKARPDVVPPACVTSMPSIDPRDDSRPPPGPASTPGQPSTVANHPCMKTRRRKRGSSPAGGPERSGGPKARRAPAERL